MKFVPTPVRAATCSLLATVFLSGSLSALAQTITLKETVVTASRIDQPLADVLPSVSVITRADIERIQATSLADLLHGEAGFEFGRNGGPGSTTSFFLRGADSTNLVVMVDGVKTMTDGLGSLASIDLALSQIERIELLRGNASALYGEAAIGGVVHIFTREFDKKDSTYASLSLGSRNSQSLSVGTVKTVNDTAFRLDAGRERTDGFSAMNPAQKNRVNPDSDGYENTFMSAKAAKKISKSLQMGVALNASLSSLGFDDGDAPSVSTDTHKFKRENYSLNTFAQVKWSEQFKSRIDLTRTGLEYRDFKNSQPNLGDYSAGFLHGEQNSLRMDNNWALNDSNLLNFGLDANNDIFESNALVSGYLAKRQSRGYFAGLTSQLGRLSLQVSARHDDISMNEAVQSISSNWSADSILLGIGYRLTDAFRLTASTSNGFRAPSASELSYNINLRPEKHRSQEVGLIYNQGETLFRGVFFDTKTNDAFVYNDTFTSIVNVGKVRNQGFELSAKSKIQGNHVKGSYVTQDPYDETNQLRLARRARQYGSIEIWRLFGVTTAGFRFLASDDRTNSAYDAIVLPGYSTLGFYLTRPITPEWTAKLKLENLTDRPYQLAYGYNTPGFGAFFSLTYQSK
jgi:vitamin B12 transporter